MSPATAKLECLDCDRHVAVGMPVRVLSSWVGSCTKEGYSSWFEELPNTDTIVWSRTPFKTTKACDEHHYKVAVSCGSPCVVRAIDSPQTSTVKLLGIHPERPGPFEFTVEILRDGGELVAQFASGPMIVRAPEEVSPYEVERKIDGPSPLAVFDGSEYFLVPGTSRTNDPPSRGTRYQPAPLPRWIAENDNLRPPDRLQRDCKTRTPGAMVWRPCSQGVQSGDDVRIDVTAWLHDERMPGDLSVTELDTPPGTWSCYRSTFAAPGAQICVRYGITGGTRLLTWRGHNYWFEETLRVGDAP